MERATPIAPDRAAACVKVTHLSARKRRPVMIRHAQGKRHVSSEILYPTRHQLEPTIKAGVVRRHVEDYLNQLHSEIPVCKRAGNPNASRHQ